MNQQCEAITKMEGIGKDIQSIKKAIGLLAKNLCITDESEVEIMEILDMEESECT